NDIKPWQSRQWCIPTVGPEYVCRMEDLPDLYEEAYDPMRPVICFDEKPCQLIGETRVPIPQKVGKPLRYDCEYERNGTANLFVTVEPAAGQRNIVVTHQRTKQDFAEMMRHIVDNLCPNADKIRIVMDNLNTHKPASLYERFGAEEARRIIRRLEFHYTPKHASWLNMAEIEISVLSRQCLRRRIGDMENLKKEISAWEEERNKKSAKIEWRFTSTKAREKLGRLYPSKSLI
ncbi:MAG: IS630 family transposase, partial [Proteobacteria bacterium]|nr:IS630 family transposase [Pseudomonadota bacterium]